MFVCTLAGSPGRVMAFKLSCTLRRPLSKATNAPKVDAQYRATLMVQIELGSAIPACILRKTKSECFVTTNIGSKSNRGSVKLVNWETGQVNTVVSGLRSAFGLAKFNGGVLVSDSDANRILFIANGGCSDFIGSGQAGTADGLQSECDLRVPLGMAVSGRTLFFVQSDSRLRMFSFTQQLCTFMRSTREFAEIFGILDPSVRKNTQLRKQLRKVDVLHALDTLDNIVGDREQWYKDTCIRLGFPVGYKSLQGPEGIPSYSTFRGWAAAAEDIRHVFNKLVSAGLEEHAHALLLHRVNQMDLEHRLGLLALGFDHTQTQQSWLPLLNRSSEEAVSSVCANTFAHCTTTQP